MLKSIYVSIFKYPALTLESQAITHLNASRIYLGSIRMVSSEWKKNNKNTLRPQGGYWLSLERNLWRHFWAQSVSLDDRFLSKSNASLKFFITKRVFGVTTWSCSLRWCHCSFLGGLTAILIYSIFISS